MAPPTDRRLVILAEGNFGFHHGKTAMGVIRFGTDEVVAVIDSTQAGRNVREWLGDSGRYDIPIVASLNAALGFLPRADALLIGIAPTGGKLPDDWRAVILAAIRLGPRHPLRASTRSSATTRSSPTRPRSAGRRGSSTTAARRSGWRRPTGRRAPARQAGDPHRRDGLCHRQDVGGPRAAAGRAGAGMRPRSWPTGQTGMMIEGWGVAVDRLVGGLRPGHGRVAGRGGREAR